MAFFKADINQGFPAGEHAAYRLLFPGIDALPDGGQSYGAVHSTRIKMKYVQASGNFISQTGLAGADRPVQRDQNRFFRQVRLLISSIG